MQLIILTGPKHSGKTSAGKELALLLSCGFVDLDDVIARQSGKSPRALFAEGPEIFRKAEEAALAAILETGGTGAAHGPSRLVIAAGGGIIDNPGALVLLQGAGAPAVPSGVLIFLDVSAETAWKRISGEGELPPFLNVENPQAAHRSLHERRSGAYRRLASFIVNAENKSPVEIAGEICCLLKNNSEKKD
jgi:shikimate kinase